jgi:hypothetical protein
MKTAHAILLGALALGCTRADDTSSTGESGSGESGSTDGSTTGDVPAACEQAGWDTSLAAFETLAEQAGGTYWYSVLTFQYINDFQWGCSYRTTVEFVADAPVRRTFELAEVADGTTEDQCTGVPFVEDGGDAIGSMDGIFDFAAYTMEQLYAGCCDLLGLEPADAYTFHFELDDEGVVDACYAIENACGEGCEGSVDGFSGFNFEAFGFGSPP